MREKPAIADEKILSRLNASYGVSARQTEFLPIGADGNAWAYRVHTDEKSYFLKIKRGQPAQSMLVVPDYLKSNGVEEVIAPIRTQDNRLYAQMDDYSLILYPFVEGDSAWEKHLTEPQMRSWGDIMRRIHDVDISDAVAEVVPHETYISTRDALFKRVKKTLLNGNYSGKYASELATMWKEKSKEIEFAYIRYRALGDRIKRQNLQHVICHADIHKANIILDDGGRIHVVDWDEVIIAPKERDLMFFDVRQPADDGFFAGYQNTDVNYVAIAYYRYDWVVQEFAEWPAWVLDDPDRPEGEQEYAVSEFKQLFDPENVLDVAHHAFDMI